MDIHRMQELIRIYDEKLDTPDCCPHLFEARFACVTADWIKSLDKPDRASIFEYIGYILHQPGESPQKLRTVMMLAMLPCQETEMLMDKMLMEGTLTHTNIMQYVYSNKMLCEKKETKRSN